MDGLTASLPKLLPFGQNAKPNAFQRLQMEAPTSTKRPFEDTLFMQDGKFAGNL